MTTEATQRIKTELIRAAVPMHCTDCDQYIPQGSFFVEVKILSKHKVPLAQLDLHRRCAKMLGADLHLEIARI